MSEILSHESKLHIEEMFYQLSKEDREKYNETVRFFFSCKTAVIDKNDNQKLISYVKDHKYSEAMQLLEKNRLRMLKIKS